MPVISHAPEFPLFFEVKHPLVLSKLTLLRQKTTDRKLFRELVHEITLLLGYEATQQLKTKLQEIQTPLEKYSAPVLEGPSPVILPILRAGIGMVDALLSLMPSAKVGHIGLYRDEKSHQPQSYYFKVPADSAQRQIYLCDPMLATGGSVVRAVELLKEQGIHQITLICLLAVPEGLTVFHQAHPDVPVFAASLDRGLDEHRYIRPGLGDAGDRLFGTL